MQIGRRITVLGAAVIAIALAVVPHIPAAAAAASSDGEESRVSLVIRRDDAWQPVDPEMLRAAALRLNPVPEGEGASARLIDWNQWFGCFSLNNETDVFAYYWFPWDGSLRNVNLKCGTKDYGYKHIREGHESQWQGTLDAARAKGWKPAFYGVESWDDLMSGVTAELVADPGPGLQKVQASNKWCTKGDFGLWDTDRKTIVYSFGVEVAWVADSDRLLTSFPSSRKVCAAG